MSRPKVTLNCVASKYALKDERIIEVFDGQTQKGCLISIVLRPNGDLDIIPYRADKGVHVMVGNRRYKVNR